MTWLPHIQAFLVTLVSVGLKGFQHKNVIGGHLKLIVVTSYLMAVADVLLVGLVVSNGWKVAFASGTGAALGMLISVTMHDRFVKKT